MSLNEEYKLMGFLNGYLGCRKYIHSFEISEDGQKNLWLNATEHYGIRCSFDEFQVVFRKFMGALESKMLGCEEEIL